MSESSHEMRLPTKAVECPRCGSPKHRDGKFMCGSYIAHNIVAPIVIPPACGYIASLRDRCHHLEAESRRASEALTSHGKGCWL